jgi:hypothetical protein
MMRMMRDIRNSLDPGRREQYRARLAAGPSQILPGRASDGAKEN